MTAALRVALLGLLVACSDAGSPVAIAEEPDRPSDPGGINASYVLVKVNGEPLPAASPIGAGDWDYGGAVYQLISATLTFTLDGTFSTAWKHQQLIDGIATNAVVEQVFVGTYAVEGSSVRFNRPDGTSTASITPTALFWDFNERFVLKFKR